MRAATAADHSKPWVTGQPVIREPGSAPAGHDLGATATRGTLRGSEGAPARGSTTNRDPTGSRELWGDGGAHAGGPVRWPGGGGAPVACEAAAARSLAAAAASCAGSVG